MWKDHFQRLYSTGANTKYRTLFECKLSCLSTSNDDKSVTILDKAAGPDGIYLESFLFGGH